MNCIILLLLLCCCGGCDNGVSGNVDSNCSCERRRHGNYNSERRERAYEANVRENNCDCTERDYDAANMAPPSWQDFPGLARDCECDN